MLSVKIKNFQSIGNISFDVDGFTVIVGKNNLGKSAIIRAIDAALTNRTGSEFIRWGKTKSDVILKKDDLEIDWSKGDTAVYKVNGKSFSKLNRAVPQPIQDAGIRKIEIGDQKLNPLIAHQFEELFLLDKPGSVITDVLSVIYNLNILSDADDLCAKDVRAKKSLLKTRESDLSSLGERIDKYKDLESIKESFKDVLSLREKTQKLSEEIEGLNRYLIELEKINHRLTSLKEVVSIKIPTLTGAEEKISECLWINQTALRFKECLIQVRSLESASKTIIPDYTETGALIDQLKEIVRYSAEWEKVTTTISQLEVTLSELKQEEFLKDRDIAEKQLEAVIELRGLTEDFTSTIKTVKNLKKEIEDITEDLTKAQEEFSAYDSCPLCSKPL
jgi:DNA repair ATPase RecN